MLWVYRVEWPTASANAGEEMRRRLPCWDTFFSGVMQVKEAEARMRAADMQRQLFQEDIAEKIRRAQRESYWNAGGNHSRIWRFLGLAIGWCGKGADVAKGNVQACVFCSLLLVHRHHHHIFFADRT